MSGRGGGGRGGGRGRGRGGAPPLAVARDDDGTVLSVTTLAGPPPLFPVCSALLPVPGMLRALNNT